MRDVAGSPTRRRAGVRAVGAVLAAAMVAGVTPIGSDARTARAESRAPRSHPASDHVAFATPSTFVPVDPVRAADTRVDPCGCERLSGDTVRVEIAARDDVPDDAVAVALTLTVTGADEPGFATIWPSGTTRRETSNLNWTAGETRANGVIVELGDAGRVDVFVSADAFVLVDVTGVFVPAPDPAAAGRFRAIDQTRVLDTRGAGSPVSDTTVSVVPPPAVPADASAIAVTVTVTGSTGWGFATAVPAGDEPPTVSTVNVDGPGQTRAASAVVPLGAGGLDVHVDGTMHVIVDVVGWFTGPAAPEGTDGRFVATAPVRLFDTRAPSVPIWEGGTRELAIDGPVDLDAAATVLDRLRADAAAVVTNLTVTETSADGWLTAYPARTVRPPTSTINWASDETVANLAITPWSTWGVAYYGFRETDLIVDVTGYFTGPAVPATEPKAPNSTPEYDGEPPQDLVREAVPPEVWAVMGGVEMRVVPALPGGAAGIAAAPPERIAFARFIYTFRRSVARSVAAHEVGHILTWRWLTGVPGASEDRIGAIGGHECLAEAIGRLLFARLGRTNYQAGYGTDLIACSTSIAAGDLAAEIVATTT